MRTNRKIRKYLVLCAALLAFSVPVNANRITAELESADDAQSSISQASLEYAWTVKVEKGYLALRTEKAYDSANEIAELYTGDEIEVLDSSDSQYWYVYVPFYDEYGYVNKDYLSYSGSFADAHTWSVKVEKGYLALRTAKAYDSGNEIDELYTGDVVEIKKSDDSGYWYVYVPSLDKFGYVDKDYLVYNARRNCFVKTVRVEKGYLALRTEKSYDEKNEIGELYTGDEVEILDSDGKKYWYVYAPGIYKTGYVNKNYLY